MVSEFQKLYGREPEEELRTISRLASLLQSELRKSFGVTGHKADPNFEMIVCLIEALINADPVNRQETGRLTGELCMPNLLGHVMQVRSEYAGYRIGIDDLFAYQEFMLDVVSKFKCSEEGLEELGVFFNNLLLKYDLKYYTLNYDSLIIDVLDWVRKNIRDIEFMKRFNTGALYGYEGLITGQEIFRKDPYFQDRRNSLFFLHGSVCYRQSLNTKAFDLRERKSTTLSGMKFQQALGLKHPIHHVMGDGGFRFDQSFISGYNKSTKLTSEPYAGIFAKFREDLFSSRELLVIGYAYHDDHVNAVFAAQPTNLKKTTNVDFIEDGDYPDMKRRFLQKVNQRVTSTRPNGDGQPVPDWNTDLPRSKVKYGRNPYTEIEKPDYDEWESDYSGTRSFIQRWNKHGIPSLGQRERKLLSDPPSPQNNAEEH